MTDKVGKDALRRLSVLRLYHLLPFSELSFREIFEAYRIEWQDTYKNKTSCRISLNKILSTMIKRKLLSKRRRNAYQISSYGKEFYDNKKEEFLEDFEESLKKVAYIV